MFTIRVFTLNPRRKMTVSVLLTRGRWSQRCKAKGMTAYFENTEGGHSAAADLEQRARRSTREFTFLWGELQ